MHLDAVEHGRKIVFLHQVKDGPANRSYGLAVAALAGVPLEVIDEAKRVLSRLEANSARLDASAQLELALFEQGEPSTLPQHTAVQTPAEQPPTPTAALLSTLTAIEPDNLTPRQALQALYQLKALLPPDEP